MSDKPQPFLHEDLPESSNVEDRRDPGYRPPRPTMAEMTEAAERERRERDPTLPDSDLARQAGVHHIGQRGGVAGLLTALAAMFFAKR